MATEVWADLSQIQDEDSLRRMWQETEDFGRKKEIRARMYKIREQRLKDFYTTNESQQSEVSSRKHALSKTHTEAIGDEGSFMTMKSKEIRDSESPTREVTMGRRGDSWSSGYLQKSSSQAVSSSQQIVTSSKSVQSSQHISSGQNESISQNISSSRNVVPDQTVATSQDVASNQNLSSSQNISSSSQNISSSSQNISSSSKNVSTSQNVAYSQGNQKSSESNSNIQSSSIKGSNIVQRGVITQSSEPSSVVQSPLKGETTVSTSIKDNGVVEKIITNVTKDKDGGETITRTKIIVKSEPKVVETVSTSSSQVEQHVGQNMAQSSYSTKSVQQSSSVHQVSSSGDFVKSERSQNEIDSTDRGAITYTDTPRQTPTRDLSQNEHNLIRQSLDEHQTSQNLRSQDVSKSFTSSQQVQSSSRTHQVSEQSTDTTDRVDSRRESIVKSDLTEQKNLLNKFDDLNVTKKIDESQDIQKRDHLIKRDEESIDINKQIKTSKAVENQDEIREAKVTRKVSDTTSIENKINRQTKENKEASTEQKIMNEIYKLDSYLSSQPTPTSCAPVGPQPSVVDNTNWPVDQEFVYQGDNKSQKPVAPLTGERGVPVKHPNNLEVAKEPTEGQYVTTYQQHYSRISEDRDTNHQYFASTLRASPIDSRSSPSPTKLSSSKGSLDRSTPDRSKSRGSPNRKTPDRDRRGSYTVERSPDSRRSTTPGADQHRKSPDSKSKRKLSSTQSKTVVKTRSSTPRASASPSPTRTSRPRKTSFSDSDSEQSDATFRKSSNSLRQSKVHSVTYKTDQKKVNEQQHQQQQETETKETKLFDLDGEKRLLTPSPTRHPIRENTPDYSSEGSITRELKISRTLTDRESKTVDSSPERSAFSPIKKFRTSPEKDSSISMIKEERKHISDSKISSDTAASTTRTTDIKSSKETTRKTSTDIIDDGFESQSPDTSPNRSRNLLTNQLVETSSRTVVSDSNKMTSLNEENFQSPERKPSQVKSKPNNYHPSSITSPDRQQKKPTTDAGKPETSSITRDRKPKTPEKTQSKVTHVQNQKYLHSPSSQPIKTSSTTVQKKTVVQKESRQSVAADRATRRTTTPRAETVVSRTRPKTDVKKPIETRLTTKTVKTTVNPQRTQLTTTTTVKTTKKELKPSPVKTASFPSRNISSNTKVSTVQTTTRTTASKVNDVIKTDKTSKPKPREQDIKYSTPKLSVTKAPNNRPDNQKQTKSFNEPKHTSVKTIKQTKITKVSNNKCQQDDVKSDESLEDEMPPAEFYNDIDETDLDGSQKIDISVRETSTEKLKPTQESLFSVNRKTESTTKITTSVDRKQEKLDTSKNKSVGKTILKNKRKVESDSSSSSEDEKESDDVDEVKVSLTQLKPNLVKREVGSSKGGKESDFLSVIIQHPKSSRESSPEKSIQSVTSDGGQTPRYADFITEPEDVEIFDASNLGPRKPIQLLDDRSRIEEESDEVTEDTLNVSVADRVSKYMEETNKTQIIPLDSQKETTKAKEVIKAKQLFENISKQQVGNDNQVDNFTSVREKRTLKKSSAEDTENIMENFQTNEFQLMNENRTVESDRTSKNVQKSQDEFIQNESKSSSSEVYKTERRLSEHSPDIQSKKAFFERKSQEQTIPNSAKQTTVPDDSTVPSYMRDTATALTRKETIQREFSFTKDDRKEKHPSVEVEKQEEVKARESFLTDDQLPKSLDKYKRTAIDETDLFKKSEGYKLGNGGPKGYNEAKQKRAEEIEKLDTFKKMEAYRVCDETKQDKVVTDSTVIKSKNIIDRFESEETKSGFDRPTESSRRRSAERETGVSEKRSFDGGEEKDLDQPQTKRGSTASTTAVTTSSKIEETVRRLSGAAEPTSRLRDSSPTKRKETHSALSSHSTNAAKIDETVRRLSRTDSLTSRVSPTRQTLPNDDHQSITKRKDSDTTKTTTTSSSRIEETVRRLSRTDSSTRVSPTRRTSGDATATLKKKEIEINQRTTEINRAGGKFGVTLRRTPSGQCPAPSKSDNNAQSPQRHQSPLNIDQSIDIESIFDLELLEQLLAKAVGYDDRRRIRAQIRLVRRQLEEQLSRGDQSINNDRKQSSVKRGERSGGGGGHVTTLTNRREAIEKVTSSNEYKKNKTDQDDSWIKRDERRKSSLKRDSPERRIKTNQSSPDRNLSNNSTSLTSYTSYSHKSPERRPTSSMTTTTTTTTTTSQKRTSLSSSSDGRRYSKEQSPSPERSTNRSNQSYTTTTTTTSTSSSSRRKSNDTSSSSPDRKRFISPTSSERVTTSSHTTTRSSNQYQNTFSSNSGKGDEVTESITSSYGVGPTDDNGKPLFGLKALRRTNTNKSIDEIDVIRVSNDETDGKENNEVRGSDGRPLFGLRALQVADTNNKGGKLMKSEMQSRKTVVSTRSTISSDGKVSMTKQMIHGEMSSKDGSNPIGKITKSTLSYNKNDRDAEPTLREITSTHTLSGNRIDEEVKRVDHDGSLSKRLLRGDSVKAITSKFSQATDGANNGSTKSSTFNRQSSHEDKQPLSSSLKTSRKSIETSSSSSNKYGVEVGGGNDTSSYRENSNKMDKSHHHKNTDISSNVVSSSTSTKKTSSSTSSFLGDTSKVTGVQDILTRMRNADLVGGEVGEEESAEDAQARSLLNKFLGASVLLQGMEAAGIGAGPKTPSSAALVRQVEKQRIMASNQRKESFDESSDHQERQLFLESSSELIQPGKVKTSFIMAEKAGGGGVEDKEGGVRRGGEETIGEVVQETTQVSSSPGGESVRVTKKEVHTTSQLTKAKSVTQSPFAKFKNLERQNSAPSGPFSGGVGEKQEKPLFRFTDPKLALSASTIKDRLLNWVQAQTSDYKNIKIENFSTSWSNGLAFCALIHHFYPDAFDYDSLTAEKRRFNFELAFRVAEERGDIFPLLDVEDMVIMRKPDWKCVFTYVQSIHRHLHKSPNAI